MMKALIYKDLLAVWKYCRTHIFMCAAFLLASIFVEEYSFLQMYPLIFIGMLVNTLIAYDERDKWDRQVLTMPVTRTQYVSAKYLTGLILQGVVLLLTAGAHALQLQNAFIQLFPGGAVTAGDIAAKFQQQLYNGLVADAQTQQGDLLAP